MHVTRIVLFLNTGLFLFFTLLLHATLPTLGIHETSYAFYTTPQLAPRFFGQERRTYAFWKEFADKEKFYFFFAGYVRNMSYLDSRQVRGVIEDYVLFFPRQKVSDRFGDDINRPGQFNIAPRETRLIANVFGPQKDSTNVRGHISIDFLGQTGQFINEMRVRQIFFVLDRKEISILAGQVWHPMTLPLIAPDTVAFDGGIPFNATAQVPQIRINMHRSSYEILAAILGQGSALSEGPVGFSNEYARNSFMPNFHVQIRSYWHKHIFGFGIDYKRLAPRIVTNKNVKTHEAINSFGGIAYTAFQFEPVDLTIKASLVQNGESYILPGGYGVHNIDPITDRRTYANISSFAIWGELVRRHRWEFGLFAGFLKNLGASKSIIPEIVDENGHVENLIYAFGPDVAMSWRIAPRIRFNVLPIQLSSEIEYSGVAFGTLNRKGRPVATVPPVHNLRLLLSAALYF